MNLCIQDNLSSIDWFKETLSNESHNPEYIIEVLRKMNVIYTSPHELDCDKCSYGFYSQIIIIIGGPVVDIL